MGGEVYTSPPPEGIPQSLFATRERARRHDKKYDGHRQLQCWECGKHQVDDNFSGALHLCKKCISHRVHALRNSPWSRLRALFNAAKTNHKARQETNKKYGRSYTGRFEISFEDLVRIPIAQRGLCYYSDMPMGFSSDEDWTVSLKRRDVKESYAKRNVVPICGEVNGIDRGVMSGNTEQGWSREKVQYVRQAWREEARASRAT